MNTAQLNLADAPRHSRKTTSRIPRIVAVSAALGIVCAAGVATAATAVAAPPSPSLTTKTTTARSVPAGDHGGHDHHHGGVFDGHRGGGECVGLIVILCN
jgi:hypothetical protein